MSDYLTKVVCLQCGHEQEAAVMAASCPECGSPWLDARYDYDAVAKQWPDAVYSRERDLWRYAELLPLKPTVVEIPMGEGFTPLVRLHHYEQIYDHQPIYFKDERHQPTNSFKDRQAALSVMAMKQAGITECVLASTGNAAVAYAAYCARAGIKLWLFLTSLVPAEKMRECAIYGAEVVKVSGTYDETKKVAAEFAQHKKIHLDRGAKAIPGKESMKTLAFEIAEQLGAVMHPDENGKWVAPDWFIQAVSGGIGPLGVLKGFSELKKMGMVDKIPKVGVIQAAGCAPMVHSFEAGQETATAVVPKTLITVLATGDPGLSYQLLRQSVLEHGGAFVAIQDGETFRSMRHLASRAGISVEPATAVAFAGLEKMLSEGTITDGEVVVVNCSGHTFPVESHILGDQYDKYILDLPVDVSKTDQTKPQEEGLGAALQHLDEQVTTIVIVDDNPNDRRLIRRLLQSYKQYRVYEARNGEEAIKVVRDRKPDLVVSDLTMPEMDGFTLLERLKSDPETADVPVMVVSAKSLTPNDRQRLVKHSASVWMKGGFSTRQLVEHVVDTLGHTPVEVIEPAESAIEKPSESAKELPTLPNADAHTVVVIDDNPRDQRLVKRMLESEGDFQVISESTGRDGLKTVYNYHPDLIILDLVLPDMDGFTIVEKLQEDPNLSDIPVVIYSAKDVTLEEKKRLQQHIRSIMKKSTLNRKQFLDAIKDELI